LPDSNTTLEKKQLKALEMIEKRMSALREAVTSGEEMPKPREASAYSKIVGRLERWREETARALEDAIAPGEARSFMEHEIDRGDVVEGVLEYADWSMEYLDTLSSAVRRDPGALFSSEAAAGAAAPVPGPDLDAGAGAVYIMHGSDETNALRLHKMINDWGVSAQFLIDDPTGALTLAQLMERSSGKADFVFVVLTLDDAVTDPAGRSYMQPRPNPLIELGYYLGSLGQEKMAILCQEEVLSNIPTNLSGIKVGTFLRSVEELTGFVQKELADVGLGPLAGRR
jgi:predicted nucleotide-binding protein